jgi:hypothetical protein
MMPSVRLSMMSCQRFKFYPRSGANFIASQAVDERSRTANVT